MLLQHNVLINFILLDEKIVTLFPFVHKLKWCWLIFSFKERWHDETIFFEKKQATNHETYYYHKTLSSSFIKP